MRIRRKEVLVGDDLFDKKTIVLNFENTFRRKAFHYKHEMNCDALQVVLVFDNLHLVELLV